MHLGDLREFVEKAELTFDIDGRHYSVPPVSSKTWLRLQAIQAATEGTGDGSKDSKISRVDLGKICLGPVFDQLTKDGVDGAELQHIMRAAYFWQLGEQDIARVLWADGGKAPAPAEEPSTSTTPTGSTSSESASVTRRPASTRATTSRRKSATNSTRSKAAAKA